MNKQRHGAILADCIERLQAGETAVDCLARYGAEAAELAPLLNAAMRLQRVNAHRLTGAQRDQAKATLRATLLGQNRRPVQPATPAPRRFDLALPGPRRALALAGMLVITFFVAITVTAVAASQPGDIAYPARVIVERAPVLLKTTAEAKTTAELLIADRRLADVEQYLAATGRLEDDAVTALLSGDQAAADHAAGMSEVARLAVAAHIASHADNLTALADAASETQTRARLQEAARMAFAIAGGLRSGPRQPETPPDAQPTASPTASPTRHPQPTLTGAPATQDAGKRDATQTPRPSATPQPSATPARPTAPHQGTAVGPHATATSSGHHGAATPTPAPTSGRNPTVTPGGSGGPGGNPTVTPGGSGEPGGNPTVTPGGSGEPGGNPTVTPGGSGGPGGNPTVTPGGSGGPGGNPTVTPGGSGGPGGNPTVTPGGSGEPGGNPTVTPGGSGGPGGNPTVTPGGSGEPGGNPTVTPGGSGEPGGNPTVTPGGSGEPGGNPMVTPSGAGGPAH